MINEAEYNALQKAKQSETLNILLRLMKAWHSLSVGKLYLLRWKNYRQWKPRTGSQQKRYWNLRKSMGYKRRAKVNGRFYIYRKSHGQYIYWQTQDRKTLKKINSFITDIKRNGAMQGIGKPELLKHDKSGLYSRRIDEVNRLVYGIDEAQNIKMISYTGHYED